MRHEGCTEVSVSVHTDGEMSRIIFSDNGKRPLEETLFFHSETDRSGSPIIHSSVPLAAEIVALHSGKIILGDEKDGPSSIIVMFPNRSIDTETLHFGSKKARFEGGIDPAMLEFADFLPPESFEK